MADIDPRIFRAYDIRGKAHLQLTSEACNLIGQAFGGVVTERTTDEFASVVVGRDARTHSPEFMNAAIAGLVAAGCRVLNMGQTPSPLNYFTICTRNLDGGVQITASHNPAEDNGIKLQTKHAEAYAGEDLQQLRKQIEANDVKTGNGWEEHIDAITPYTEYLTNVFGGIGIGKTIVVDGGNGVAGPLYCDVLRKVGCKVVELYIEPDGTFPNHAADPSKWETLADLQKSTKELGAHAGFALDGDGDRFGMVDETGTIRTADEILLLLAKDHLSRNPGAPVIFTVSNSGTLQTEITKWGGRPVMCKVGHSFVEHAMRENNALLGGEQSGHFFCGEDYFSFDDALVGVLRVLSIMKKESVSSLMKDFPKVYQAQERRPHCADDVKAQVIQKIRDHFAATYPVVDLDGARIDFGDGAWAGIRMSNTSPCLSVCLEARSPEKLAEIEKLVLEHLGTYEEIEM
ncbi:MAG: phosphomannomutase / phosphoglucomutase [Candidatus Peribacteria bacterium]|nr:phosphomannomutase / phosphoglucomutase [Candidatus Peribacteria bacterium]